MIAAIKPAICTFLTINVIKQATLSVNKTLFVPWPYASATLTNVAWLFKTVPKLARTNGKKSTNTTLMIKPMEYKV